MDYEVKTEELINTKETEISQKDSYIKKISNKLKNGKKPKKKTIIIAAVIAVIAIAVVLVFVLKKDNTESTLENTLVAVERRTIQNTVTGSSVIEPKDSYSVTPRVTGEILSDFFNEGDVVKKGDKLYLIDTESAEKSVKSAKNSLEKAKRSYDDVLEDSSNLSVKSEASGIVGELLVKKGDNVSSGTKIANIYSNSYMKLRLPFNENDVKAIKVGSGATVTVAGTGTEIWGSVTEVSSASVTTESHAIVRYVTVEVKNPGALSTNDSGTAVINGVASNNSANFEYISESTITAKTSGRISELKISEKDKVSKNQVVAILTSDDIQTKIKDAKTEVEDAELNLEKAQETLEDYTITAPIDGTIVTKNKKAGDNLTNSSSDSNVMAEIYDLSSLKFQIDVDETEVDKIKVGQTVTVTADAVEGEFEGVVEKVGIDGTSSNGVTTYPIKVVIEEYGDLLPGMNITAEIVVEESVDTLAIPVSAVQRGGFVYVKDDGKDEKSSDENEAKKNDGTDENTELNDKQPSATQETENADKAQMPQRTPGTSGSGERGERPQRMNGESPSGQMPQRASKDGETTEKTTENKTENTANSKEASNNNEEKGNMPMMDNVPEGYKAVRVELGINDLEYIEVLSGLSEGDEVLVQTVAKQENTSEEQQQMQGMPGMGGGMPGGMGGGMPQGGMGGGNQRSGGNMSGGNRMSGGGMR